MAQLLTGTKIGTTTIAQGVTGTITLPAIAGTLMVGNSAQNSTGGILDYLGNGSVGASAYVYSGSSRTIATTTEVVVNCDSALYNTNTSIYTQSGGGIQVNVAGVYTISGMTSITAGAVTYRLGCSIKINTTLYLLNYVPPLANSHSTGTITLNLAANDIIYLTCYQNSTADRTLTAGLTGSMLCVVKEK